VEGKLKGHVEIHVVTHLVNEGPSDETLQGLISQPVSFHLVGVVSTDDFKAARRFTNSLEGHLRRTMEVLSIEREVPD
jgi:hypothetical protein